MAPDGFSALQFVPPAPKVLAEIETTIQLCFSTPHSPIEAFTQSHLK